MNYKCNLLRIVLSPLNSYFLYVYLDIFLEFHIFLLQIQYIHANLLTNLFFQ